ncbi:hypothetical protein ANO14919_067320 [Xylariales sp. No.14919]|nr:hypothetical protein ANO14919_067320 [Xylariales sp. No.14919]
MIVSDHPSFTESGSFGKLGDWFKGLDLCTELGSPDQRRQSVKVLKAKSAKRATKQQSVFRRYKLGRLISHPGICHVSIPHMEPRSEPRSANSVNGKRGVITTDRTRRLFIPSVTNERRRGNRSIL